jgi:hypothetical protein
MVEELLFMDLLVHHTVQGQEQLCHLLYIKNSIVVYLIYNWLRKTGAIPPLPNLSLWVLLKKTENIFIVYLMILSVIQTMVALNDRMANKYRIGKDVEVVVT